MRILSEHCGAILVVEDDPLFRRVLVRTLETQGFNVCEAVNGLQAKTILHGALENFALIISDIRMPEMDGVQLLEHVRMISKIPFILMSGNSEILDSKKAIEIGANAFVAKPFRIDSLLQELNRCLVPLKTPDEAGENRVSPAIYCPIHVAEFFSDKKLLSDVYLKLGAKQFLQVARKGELFPHDRIKDYQSRAIEFLYVTIQDFGVYVNFNANFATVALSSSALDRSKKTEIVIQATKNALAICCLNEMTKEVLKPSIALVETTIHLLLEDGDILDVFVNMLRETDRLYNHGVAVAVYSAAVAAKLGWSSPSTLFKVIVGGLLHDVGKGEMNMYLSTSRRTSPGSVLNRFRPSTVTC